MRYQGIGIVVLTGVMILAYQNCGAPGLEAASRDLSSVEGLANSSQAALTKIPNDVVFEIPRGTGTNNWNSQANPLVVYVGQTLWINNRDDVGHKLHTGGEPCKHQDNTTQPGGSYQCVVSKPKLSMNGTYDHDIGGNFYLIALDGKALYASSCANCHGAIDVSTKLNSSANQIAFAIDGVPEMQALRLSDDQIKAIAFSLQR